MKPPRRPAIQGFAETDGFAGMKLKEKSMENNSQLIIYQTEKGETKLEVRLEKRNGLADTKIDGGAVSND